MSRQNLYRGWDGEKMLPPEDLTQSPKYRKWLGRVDVQLMQFVGLVDHADTPVFEGDILRFTYWWFDGNLAETPMVGEVVYVPSEASYGLSRIRNREWLRHIGSDEEDTQTFSGWDFTSDDIEILGNRFEHPHLLEAAS